MKYRCFFTSKADENRNFDIKYAVCEDNGCFFIESFIEGGTFSERAVIENQKESGAESVAKLLAQKAVHPLHIEEVISDMRI